MPLSKGCHTLGQVGTLADLLERFDADARLKGRQFEHLCAWYLANDPLYRTQLARVWLWDDWPGRWGPDAGIDLVAEDRNGELWAIQAKAYDPGRSVTKADVQTFLSESNRLEFSYRLLIATTDRLGPTARRTIEAQEKQVGFLGLSELEAAEVSWPAALADLRPRPPRSKKPRPHQRHAVRDLIGGLAVHDRGQLVMACGTGKTLVALALAERLEAERVLVLVPSLSLLSQTLREWVANTTAPCVLLAVCSDETVSERDAMVSKTAELGLPVTTDPGTIAAFLASRVPDGGRRVVFATYQSSPRIAAAYKAGNAPELDLAVADEAHRCAGRISSDFATVLDADAIPARRRLFMTATPRYFTGKVLREAKEADLEVASMDDEATFGPVLHRLTFGEAIGRGLLSDYQVVVVGTDDSTYRAWAEGGRLVELDGPMVASDARMLAGQVGLAKAIAAHRLRRTITFHARVAAARRFAHSLPAVIRWMPDEDQPSSIVWAQAVSGEMSAGARNVALQRLRHLDDGEAGILANARCLAEGVDVPTLDGVAFVDPRRSEVEIVQAVGRAIRKAEDKTLGTIVLPVFISSDDDPDLSLDDSAFRPVWDVLRALRAHDADLAEELDSLRRELGHGATGLKLPSKIHLDLPEHVGTEFAEAFTIRTVEATTRPWEFWYGLLEVYAAEYEHTRVPNEADYHGVKLGGWVREQRVHWRKGRLDSERTARLEAMPGWTWDPFADDWMIGYEALQAYIAANGHGRVHDDLVEADYALGKWVTKQRMALRSGRIDPERKRILDGTPEWSWEPRVDRWEDGYEHLQTYVERTGTSLCPANHREPDGFKLGQWCGVNRSMRVKRILPPERAARLESLPEWSWQPRRDSWEPGFEHMTAYAEREGHSRVPQRWLEPDGFKLGQWVSVQRTEHAKGQMKPERARRLESIPSWLWNPYEADFDEGLSHLERYVADHDDARVRQDFVNAEGFPLGQWVAVRRREYAKGKLEPVRATRLETLPGWVWDKRQLDRDAGYAAVVAFFEREGHLRVSRDHIENGIRLGSWINNAKRRHKKGVLPVAQVERLEALPCWRWVN
jgi:superfamily II DNA or RNA helicase